MKYSRPASFSRSSLGHSLVFTTNVSSVHEPFIPTHQIVLSAAILVLNVRSYYEPLRQLVRNGIDEGYINARNEHLIIFIDGPSDHSQHDSFDWGRAALDVLDNWQPVDRECYYDWSKSRQSTTNGLVPL